jgi:hypothetical protein
MLFPSQANILTEVTTATRVAEFMFDGGLAQAERPRDIRTWIEGSAPLILRATSAKLDVGERLPRLASTGR